MVILYMVFLIPLTLGAFHKVGYGQFCLDSNTRIRDRYDCEEAARDLGLDWGQSWWGPNDFPGCLHTRDPRDKVYFNLSPHASNDPNGDPKFANYAEICKGEDPDKPYGLGEMTCTQNPFCAITGCVEGCCIDGMCCTSCPKIDISKKEEVCGFCSPTLECPPSCPYCVKNSFNDTYQCLGDLGLREHIQLDLDKEIANLSSSNLVEFQSANSDCSSCRCDFSVLKAMYYCRKECGGQEDCIVPCAKRVLLTIHDKYCWPCIKRGCCTLNLPCCDYEKEAFISPPEYSKGNFTMYVTCDDIMEIYADTNLLRTNRNWWQMSPVYIPPLTKTIQINCVDVGNIGGILASSTIGLITDYKWQCTWNSGVSWVPAYQIQNNAINRHPIGWPVIPGIAPNAYWIWSGPEDWRGKRKHVNCKIDLY